MALTVALPLDLHLRQQRVGVAGGDDPREAGLERVGEHDDADVGAHRAQREHDARALGAAGAGVEQHGGGPQPLDGAEQVARASPATAGTVKPPAVRRRACRPSATRRCSLKTTTPVSPARAIGACWAMRGAHDPIPHCVARARTSTGSGASPRTHGPSATAWAGRAAAAHARRAPRRLAHEDLAGRGLGGQPRGEVDGEAEPVAAVLDGGTGVDADAGPQRRSVLRDGDAEAHAVGGVRPCGA